jgi:hypothetical protein
LTRGRTATSDPFDLSAVSSSDELFDALSSRRLADVSVGRADDPAASLLAALVADVDMDAPPLAAPVPARVACGVQGSCRRGVRAFVTFGVAALVLTSAGAAAAGGHDLGAMGTNHGSVRPGDSERSNENVQHQDPLTGISFNGDKLAARHAGARHPDVSPPAEPESASGDTAAPAAEDQTKSAPESRQQWEHRGRTWGRRRSSADSRHSRSDGHSSSPKRNPEPEQTPPAS